MIPYADAFAVELVGDYPGHLLVIAHFDFKAAEQDLIIELLPPKSKA